MPETFVAPMPRADTLALKQDIDLVVNHPVIDGLLKSIGGMLVVLNEQQQIMAVNRTFLKTLGGKGLDEGLLLRLGEAMQCTHAADPPQGCGTTKFCASCGAAVAIGSSLRTNGPAENICALTAKRGETTEEISLAVKAQPLTIQDRRFLLLFLQDITKQQFLLSLERTFFHDLNNILNGLVGSCQLCVMEYGESPEIKLVSHLVQRLHQEIVIQKTLSNLGNAGLTPNRQPISSEQILCEVHEVFARHPAAQGKTIAMANNAPGLGIESDMALLLRVLCNMVTNALEATEDGGEIKFSVDGQASGLSVKVWNKGVIPDKIRPRVFQRHFSTKGSEGRGLGTYSMKIFGEKYLGGEVGFHSSAEDGTTFWITL